MPFEETIILFLLALAIAGVIIGIGAAALLFYRHADRLRQPIPIFQKSFYVDNLYWGLFAEPLKQTAKAIATIFEPKIFDRSISAITRATQGVAYWLQQVQSGQIRSYVAWMVLGSVLLAAFLVYLR